MIRKIYEQQKYMYDNHTHSVENRIVSVSQPFVRPIVRGKAGKPVEFGMKLDISVADGWTRLECRSFDAYNEATKLREMIEKFHRREGHYPSRVLADKIYRNRENLRYCKEKGIRLSGPALGRPKKGEERNKAQDYQDECERVEVERKFSLGKRKCGMRLVFPVGFSKILNFFHFSEDARADCDRKHPAAWYLEVLVVDESMKGCGLGNSMIQDCLIPYVQAQGGQELTLITNTEGNRKFYKKNGFREFAERMLEQNEEIIGNWSFCMDIQKAPILGTA